MVSTRKKKGQNKKQLNPSDEILNDFVIGNGTTQNTMGNETLESQADGRHEDFQKVVAVQVKTKSLEVTRTTESKRQLTALLMQSKNPCEMRF